MICLFDNSINTLHNFSWLSFRNCKRCYLGCVHTNPDIFENPYIHEYSVFPVPLGQFTWVTYPRRTGGKHLTFSLGPRNPKRFSRAEQELGNSPSTRKRYFGSLSNYDDDDNDNVQKNKKQLFYQQNNCSTRASRFLVHLNYL